MMSYCQLVKEPSSKNSIIGMTSAIGSGLNHLEALLSHLSHPGLQTMK